MLIGLVGLKGSGKDTVARTLMYEFGFKKDSFAKPLKDAVASVFNWDRKMLEGDTAKSREWREKVDENWSVLLKRQVTPRQILQELGTDVFRDNFHSNIWIDSFVVRNALTSGSVVVSDVRFTNEMKAIVDLGGILVRVKRGNDPAELDRLRDHIESYQEQGVSGELDPALDLEDYIQVQERFTAGELGNINYTVPNFPHRSEWDWLLAEDIIDFTINNDGTLDDLQDNVRILANDLGHSSSRLLEVTENGIGYAE